VLGGLQRLGEEARRFQTNLDAAHLPLDLGWHIGEVQELLCAERAGAVGISAQDCFFLDAMDGFGAGVGASVLSLTPIGMLWANMRLKSGSCFTRDNRPYHG
jgi:hypothetical protein